jgi:hypothetical protein
LVVWLLAHCRCCLWGGSCGEQHSTPARALTVTTLHTHRRGFVLGYRHRKLSDPYFGSPWWSVAVGWENHGTDRRCVRRGGLCAGCAETLGHGALARALTLSLGASHTLSHLTGATPRTGALATPGR